MDEYNTPEDGIMTGEGVELELPAATVLSRIASGVVDYWLLFIALIITLWSAIPILRELNQAQITATVIASMAVFFWLIPALITMITKGSSLGRLMLRTRVVTTSGTTISGQQSFMRATVGIVEIWLTFGVLATVVSFLSKRGQRFGDMAAGTYVVRWPKKATWALNITMPAELAGWAQLAQTRPLPTGLSLNAAAFLKSRTRLSPQARTAQARALATACESYVSPPPPWGTDPESFIEAVLLVRYDVERRRYEAVNARRSRLGWRIGTVPYGLQATGRR